MQEMDNRQSEQEEGLKTVEEIKGNGFTKNIQMAEEEKKASEISEEPQNSEPQPDQSSQDQEEEQKESVDKKYSDEQMSLMLHFAKLIEEEEDPEKKRLWEQALEKVANGEYTKSVSGGEVRFTIIIKQGPTKEEQERAKEVLERVLRRMELEKEQRSKDDNEKLQDRLGKLEDEQKAKKVDSVKQQTTQKQEQQKIPQPSPAQQTPKIPEQQTQKPKVPATEQGAARQDMSSNSIVGAFSRVKSANDRSGSDSRTNPPAEIPPLKRTEEQGRANKQGSSISR
ncbi:MAG: hypothetical protein LBG48_05565 [Rickettsiales bacterium]|jgi:hypothetical protein|nr:hypothetical protein [Rickettsiales bacterium]